MDLMRLVLMILVIINIICTLGCYFLLSKIFWQITPISDDQPQRSERETLPQKEPIRRKPIVMDELKAFVREQDELAKRPPM